MRMTTASKAPEMHAEREITAPVPLCGPDGRLNRAAIGWSRHPLHRATCRRRSRARRSGTTGPSPATTCSSQRRSPTWSGCSSAARTSSTARTQRHIDAGASCGAGHDRDAGGRRAATWSSSIPPCASRSLDEGAGTRIRVEADDFGGVRLEADILIERPAGHETLNVVIPWSDVQFQFTSKQNTLPASGFVQLGDERFEFAQPVVRLPRLRPRRLAGAHGLELGRGVGRAGRTHASA